jgi:6-pyruvoyltetrahydropterin/6-carboxytetrahydropterin synthase
MLELTRTLRFCLNGDGSLAADAPAANTFAWWPPLRGLGRYYELEVTCVGEADASTGYFINIKHIDTAVRRVALPLVSEAARDPRKSQDVAGLVRRVLAALLPEPELKRSVSAVRLRLTPTYHVAIEEKNMTQVLVSQQYEFSAAHRLHAAGLSDEQNRATFGKCNNPAGHGHNYKLEVAVRAAVDRSLASEPEKLDAVVDRAVVQKLDHKNLSVDAPEFRGVNTSVENIARVVYGMLAGPVKELGAELDQVRVWETGKTVCTFRG